jgi:hypothetical protein
MNGKFAAVPLTLLPALCLSLGMSVAGAEDNPLVTFTYQTFTVPGAVTLSVESINDSGTVSGYYTDASGDTTSLIRASNGTITTYADPKDTSSPSYTQGGQINKNGLVAGEYFNTAAITYEGFVYKSSTGTFSSYQVPGEPQYTSTGLTAINDKGNLCGFIFPPPYTLTSAFIEVSGTVTIFSVNSATTSACYALNDAGTAVGYYADSAGVYHGWMRTSTGTITTIDVPGAATTPGTAPCGTASVAGTVVLGINAAGYVSGHYWDTSYNEHGFIRTPSGGYIHINAPGAYQTSGGGLNDHVVLVGHYLDSSCNWTGYIATP